MGRVVVALSGAVGALAVVGGLAALAAGLLALASNWGTSGFGALYLLSLGVLLGGGGAAVLVSGLVLRRAFRTLSALGPDLPTPTPRSRLASTSAALSVVLVAGVALALVAINEGLKREVVLLNLALVVICLTAAAAARYLPGRPIGGALLAVALLGAGAGALEASMAVDRMNREAALAERRRAHADRFAPILEGPTASQAKDAVGQVGTWRPLTGWTYPELHDDWPYAPKDVLIDLNGRRVRLALVGQCWTPTNGARLRGTVWVAIAADAMPGATAGAAPAGTAMGLPMETPVPGPARVQVALPALRCDGEVHAGTAEPVTLADSFTAATPSLERQEWLTAVAAPDLPATMDEGGPAHAVRWLLFISEEPASDVSPLRAAVAGVWPALRLE